MEISELSFYGFIAEQSKKYGDLPAFTCGDTTVSYREFLSLVDKGLSIDQRLFSAVYSILFAGIRSALLHLDLDQTVQLVVLVVNLAGCHITFAVIFDLDFFHAAFIVAGHILGSEPFFIICALSKSDILQTFINSF